MTSAWEIKGIKEFAKLDHGAEADVAIVGGGLAGIWCAHILSKEGKKVILVEKEKLGRAATLYTTGFVTQVIDTSITHLVRMYGNDGARLAWRAGEEAIKLIEDTATKEGIECELMRLPFYSYAASEHELKGLRQEADALHRLGFKAQIVEPIDGFKNVGALEVPDQAKYHPMKFFRGLVEAALKNGVEIYEDTEALKAEAGIISLKGGNKVKAKDIIIATYDPLNNPKPTHGKKGMYTSYVYELEAGKNSFPDGMYVDQMNPYHYFRFDNLEDKERIIVGGEDHRAELSFEGGRSFKALKEFIDTTFPNLKYDIKGKWSGGILESSDGLPLIGSYAPGLYVASAFSGNGMTYSAIAGKVLADEILGRISQYSALYDPKRHLKPKAFFQKFLDYGGEFFGGALKNLFKK